LRGLPCRVTLVAEQHHAVVAAAHLLRYFTDERAGTSYRGSGGIHWLLFWPEAPTGNPYWTDGTDAAAMLIRACIRQLEEWGVARQDAGGDLPSRGVFGVPEQWPHIRELYRRAGSCPPGTPKWSTWPGWTTFPTWADPPWPGCPPAGRSG
jgi:hypothetical protein